MTRRFAQCCLCIAVAGCVAFSMAPGISRGAAAGADDEISVTRLQRDIAANGARIDDLTRQIDDTERAIAQLNADIATTQTNLATTTEHADAVRTTVLQRAAALYTLGRPTTDVFTGFHDLGEAMAAQHYGDRLSRADNLLFAQLTATAQDLSALEAQLEAQRVDEENQSQQLQQARAALVALLDKQRKLLAALDVIPVMGRAQLNPTQLAAWFTSLGYSYRLSGGMSIGTLIGVYYDEGNAEGVRPDMAFAQSILETGYFRSAADNNYAGLGACDTCAGEPVFPSPRDGIRAQIQHLKNYADPDSRASGLAHPPQPTWYGSDPAVAIHNFDTFFAKGHAQTWQAMGKGNWATDPNYSTKILSIYFRMVVYAADH